MTVPTNSASVRASPLEDLPLASEAPADDNFRSCQISDWRTSLQLCTVGVYRIRSVDPKSEVYIQIQKLKLHHTAKLWKNYLEFETLDVTL
jgi:hypothetical protein